MSLDMIIKKKGILYNMIQERLEGKLPVIKIAEHNFVFDLQRKELTPEKFRMSDPRLKLEHMRTLDKGLRFLFDTITLGHGVMPQGMITDFPRDLLVVQIPFSAVLDPIGFALHNNINYLDLLKIIPLRDKYEAKIIPWEKTRYTRLIEENRWQEARERKEREKRKVIRSLKGKRPR